MVSLDNDNKREVDKIWNTDPATPMMTPGGGTIMKLHFTISPTAVAGQSASIALDGYSRRLPQFDSPDSDAYEPMTSEGTISTMVCGDVDGNSSINILDETYIIGYLYKGGPVPVCW